MLAQTPAKPVVLAVEDNKFIQDLWFDYFKDKVILWQARSHEEAEMVVRSYDPSTISIVIMDGCLRGGELDTIPIIDLILTRGFKGEIIAASSKEEYNKQMLLCGCTRSEHEKHKIPSLVFQMLKIPESLTPCVTT